MQLSLLQSSSPGSSQCASLRPRSWQLQFNLMRHTYTLCCTHWTCGRESSDHQMFVFVRMFVGPSCRCRENTWPAHQTRVRARTVLDNWSDMNEQKCDQSVSRWLLLVNLRVFCYISFIIGGGVNPWMSASICKTYFIGVRLHDRA